MLTVPRTRPSRWTIRFAGGSSTATGAGSFVEDSTAGGASVGALVITGASVGAGAMVGASATVVDGGGGSAGTVAGTTLGPSCLRNCAATKAYALVGATIWVQCPLVSRSVTLSPR